MGATAGGTGIRGVPFRLLLAAAVLGFGGYSLLLPVVPLWVARGGAGAFGAGASTGVFMLVTVLTQLGVPWLLRRVGHRWALGSGLTLVGAPAPLFALSAGLAPVLALSAVRGIGFGLLTVAGSALVAELSSPGEQGRGSALLGLAIGLPQLVLLPAGVGVVDRFGFTAVFAASAAPLLGMLFVPFIRTASRTDAQAPELPAVPEASAAGARAWRELLRGTVGPMLAMLACSVAQAGLVTFLPLAASSHAAPVVPLALFGTAAGMMLGRFAAGELVDRRQWGGRLLLPGVLLALLGMLVEVAVVGASGPAAVGLVAGAALVGVGFGLVQNDSLVATFAAAGPARYGAASALWNIAYDAGAGAGATGLGAVAQPFGYAAAFATSALFLLVVAPATRWSGRAGRPEAR